ncbi:MAG TPA: hypothetical protein VKR59_16955 [Terriglobales bacterium]|nr:hypothetical protein [Terriglobales bacterium]
MIFKPQHGIEFEVLTSTARQLVNITEDGWGCRTGPARSRLQFTNCALDDGALRPGMRPFAKDWISGNTIVKAADKAVLRLYGVARE